MKIDNNISNDLFLTELAKRIRHARIVSRIKQEDLAAQSGISRSALVKLENGDGGVRLMTFVAVMRSLRLMEGLELAIPAVELTPNELIELELNRKPSPKRVRNARNPRATIRAWGDGTSIER